MEEILKSKRYILFKQGDRMIKIWSPRYHDRKVLIAKYKVSNTNQIIFTKAKSLLNRTFTLSGETIKKYPLETNGTIPCYAVPLEEFV